uniref:Uncharacterized protein n=1 Tax=Meloidogyne enterolobii TaxID=390850 RepID=A0A6V7VW15_MELEN|nr:unnamed protein product [Meloidogyne enterolobii]
MFEWKVSRESALETFEKNKPRMHNFTIQFVQSLLNNKNKKGANNEMKTSKENDINEHIENGIEVSEDIYLNISKEEDKKDDFISKNRKLVSPNGIKKATNGCQKTK